MPAHRRGRVLFADGVTYGNLESRFAAGALIKKTTLTEDFTIDDFRAKYPSALILFTMPERSRLTVSVAGRRLEPRPGKKLIALVDVEDAAQARAACSDDAPPQTKNLLTMDEQKTKVRCPGCGRAGRVLVSFAGRKVKCPATGCGQRFLIPMPPEPDLEPEFELNLDRNSWDDEGPQAPATQPDYSTGTVPATRRACGSTSCGGVAQAPLAGDRHRLRVAHPAGKCGSVTQATFTHYGIYSKTNAEYANGF